MTYYRNILLSKNLDQFGHIGTHIIDKSKWWEVVKYMKYKIKLDGVLPYFGYIWNKEGNFKSMKLLKFHSIKY